RAGALETLLPQLHPSELWQRSGRWQGYTAGEGIMFHLEDRQGRELGLGPTHEEVITSLAGELLRSYRQLPVNLYQIQTKFRDEIRPRFGLMRGREFIMKDAYSFHADEASLDDTYQEMRRTYRRIFQRAGLETVPVEADSGAMGGSGSEEFMVPSEIGEEILLLSEKYRSNQEKTPVIYNESLEAGAETKRPKPPAIEDMESIDTPKIKTIEELAKFLKVDSAELLKSVLYRTEHGLVFIGIRGDRDINEVKLKNHLKCSELEPAADEDFKKIGSVTGSAGPFGLKNTDNLQILFDLSALTRPHWITGGNARDLHVKGFWLTDEQRKTAVDLALAVDGDPSPAGDGPLKAMRGIEVGHIFKLGKKYTEAFKMTVLDPDQKPITPIMGCYGVGINRTMATVIEQSHDEKGIVWPISVAPFEVCLVSITKTDEEKQAAQDVYDAFLKEGIDVLWDDRDLRPGVRFNDAELLGYPIRVTLGKFFFQEGQAELQIRKSGESSKIEAGKGYSGLIQEIQRIRKELFEELKADDS
ncbi:MAG TPA: proline--tRNA ligase, partial [Leptospiraceae bacterium]|nr:proline--tRNA ligase [Leptospiraceae bacterium]